jgi:SsrA-binding protein
MAKKKKTDNGPPVLGENRKARYNYTVEETLECGLVLQGTEVKSMKASRFSFPDAFCEITNGELFIKNLHITPYDFGNIHNHPAERTRKLLAHKQEIRKWARKVNEKGYTLIPLKFYLVKGRVKVEVGLCKGKKMYDKRETIKKRMMNRDDQRDLKYR